jgi:hypothetical protein
VTNQYSVIRDGIHLPPIPVQHRDEEYEEGGFETLRNMLERHFWYHGRHQFLLAAVNRYLSKSGQPPSAIELGGGVGVVRVTWRSICSMDLRAWRWRSPLWWR